MKLFRDKDGEVGRIVSIGPRQFIFLTESTRVLDSPSVLIGSLGLEEVKTYYSGALIFVDGVKYTLTIADGWMILLDSEFRATNLELRRSNCTNNRILISAVQWALCTKSKVIIKEAP